MTTATKTYRQQASQSQQEDLIVGHLGLVRQVLCRLALPAMPDRENLEAAGVLGLVEAARNFDPSRGTAFKTFAYLRIRGAILDELRRNSFLPQHVLEQVGRVREAYARLPGQATPEALAEVAGMSVDDVADSLAAMRLCQMTEWDDATPHEHGDGRQPDVLAEHSEQKARLAQAIEALPERERIIVTLYYLEDLRLREIGLVLGLSESRISRLLNTALFRLRESLGPHQP